MSATIDERVVEMRFDNSQFEKNAAQTMKTLKSLDTAIMHQSGKTIDDISKSINKLSFKKVEDSLDSLNDKFNTVGIFGKRMIENIADSSYSLLKKLTSSVWNKSFGFITSNIFSGGKARAQKIEDAKFSLQGIFGDKATGRIDAVMEDVSDSVQDTAYGYDEAAKAASMLVTSGRKASAEGGKLLMDLKAIAGVTSQTNGYYQDIAEIFTKVAAKGHILTDQLNQLNTRGVSGLETITNYFNKVLSGSKDVKNATAEVTSEIKRLAKGASKVNAAQVQEMISNTKKGGGVSYEIFSAAMNDAFAENAFRANQTLSGVTANLAAQFKQIGQKFYAPLLEQNSELVQLIDSVRLKVKAFKEELFFSDENGEKNVAVRLADHILITARAIRYLVETIDIDKLVNATAFAIEGVVNIVTNLRNVLYAVIDGFHDAFGYINEDSILRVAESFYRFTEAIVVTEDTLSNFRTGAAGVSNLVYQIINLVFKFIKAIVPGGKTIGNTLSVIIEALGKVFYYIGVITGFVGDLIGSLTFIDNIFDLIGKGIDFILNSVLKIISAFKNATDYVDNIANIDTFFNSILDVVNLLIGAVGSFFGGLLSGSDKFIDKGETMLGTTFNILGAFGQGVSAIVNWINETRILQTAMEILGGAVVLIAGTVKTIYDYVKELSKSYVIPNIIKGLEKLYGMLKSIGAYVLPAVELMIGAFAGLAFVIYDIFTPEKTENISQFGSALDGIAKPLENIRDSNPDGLLGKFITRILDFFNSFKAGKYDAIFNTVSESIENVKKNISDFYEKLKNGKTGILVLDVLVETIKTIKNKLIDNELLNDVITKIKEFGAILFGTSKELIDAGGDFNKTGEVIGGFFGTMDGAITDGVKAINKWDLLREKLGEIIAGIKAFVGDIFKDLIPILEKVNWKAILAAAFGVIAIKAITSFMFTLSRFAWNLIGQVTAFVNELRGAMVIVNEYLPELFRSMIFGINALGAMFAGAAFLEVSIGITLLINALNVLVDTVKGNLGTFAAIMGLITLLTAVIGGIIIIVSMLNSSRTMRGISKKIGSKAMDLVGISLAVGALSVFVMSLADFLSKPFSADWPDRLKIVGELIAGVAGVMAIAMGAIKLFDLDGSVFTAFLGVAALLVAVTYSFNSLFSMKNLPKDTDVRLGFFVVLIIGVAGIVGALIKFGKIAPNENVASMPIWTIIGIAGLLLSMVESIKQLMKIKITEEDVGKLFIYALLIGAVIYIIKTLTKISSAGNSALSAGGTLLGLAALLISIVESLNILINMDFFKHGYLQAGLKIFAMIGILWYFKDIMNTLNSIQNRSYEFKIGSTLLGLAGFLIALALSLAVLSKVPFSGIMKGVAGISIVLLVLAKAVDIMNDRFNTVTTDYKIIIGLAAVMLAAMVSLAVLSGFDATETLTNAIALGAVMLALGGSIALIKKVGKKVEAMDLLQLLLMIASIFVIAKSISMLQSMGIDQVLVAAISIIALLAAIGVMIYALDKIDPSFDGKDAITILAAIGVIAAIAGIMSFFSTQGDWSKAIVMAKTMLIMVGAIAGIMAATSIFGPASDAISSAWPGFLSACGMILVIVFVIIAIIAVIGELNKNGFMDKAVASAETFVLGLGRISTAFVRGMMESFGESFEKVSENIKNFAANTKEFFETIQNLDSGKLGNLVSLTSTIAEISSNASYSFDNIDNLGMAFIKLGLYMSKFAELLDFGEKSESIDRAINLLKTLASFNTEIGMESTGVMTWADDIDKLPTLGSNIMTFAANIKSITDDDVENTKKVASIFIALSDPTNPISNQNGLLKYLSNFSTTEAVSNFAGKLAGVAVGLKSFNNNSFGLNSKSVERASYARDMLVAMSSASDQITTDKGILGWLINNDMTDIEKMGQYLPGIGAAANTFALSTQNVDAHLVEVAGSVGNVFTELSSALHTHQGGLADATTVTKFSENIDGFGEAFKKFYDRLSTCKPERFTQFVAAMDNITKVVTLDYTSIVDLPTKLGELAQGGIEQYMAAFTTNEVHIAETMAKFVNKVYWMLAGTSGLGGNGVLINNANKYASAGVTARNAFADGLIADFVYLTNKCNTLADHVKTYLIYQDNLDKYKEAGLMVATSMAEGMMSTEAITALEEAASSMASVIQPQIQNTLDEHSPSPIFMNIGYYVARSLAMGMNDGVQEVGEAAYSVASVIEDEVRDTTGIHSISDIFKGIGMDINNSLIEGLWSNKDKVKEVAESVGISINDAFYAILGMIKDQNITDFSQETFDKLFANIEKNGKEYAIKMRDTVINGNDELLTKYSVQSELKKRFDKSAPYKAHMEEVNARKLEKWKERREAQRERVRQRHYDSYMTKEAARNPRGVLGELGRQGLYDYAEEGYFADQMAKLQEEAKALTDTSFNADDIMEELSAMEEETKKANETSNKSWSGMDYHTSNGTSGGAYGIIVEEIKVLEAQVQDIQNRLGGLNVVMDTGALVGQITPAVDKAMGNQAILQGRRQA